MASKNRVAVFLRVQNPAIDTPAHRCSPRIALLVVSSFLANDLKKDYKAIQLKTDEPWALTKDRFRAPAGEPLLPKIKPPLEVYPVFMMSYPPRHYEAEGARHQEEIWMTGVNKPHER